MNLAAHLKRHACCMLHERPAPIPDERCDSSQVACRRSHARHGSGHGGQRMEVCPWRRHAATVRKGCKLLRRPRCALPSRACATPGSCRARISSPRTRGRELAAKTRTKSPARSCCMPLLRRNEYRRVCAATGLQEHGKLDAGLPRVAPSSIPRTEVCPPCRQSRRGSPESWKGSRNAARRATGAAAAGAPRRR